MAPAGPWPAPTAPAAPSRRGRRIGFVVAAVGVVAVLGVGALAVQALVAGGGASSPEAAVDRLAAGIVAEDPVAVTAALDPAEVGSLGTLIEDIEDHAQETGFAPDGDSFAGIDLTADDLEYEVEDMGGGLARVEVVGGEVGYSFDPDQLGEETQQILGDEAESSSGQVDLDDLGGDEDLYLVTVRRGGGWYVSVLHTLADLMVEGLDLPPADGDAEIDRSDPAPDPEAAVTGFVEALVAGDVDALAGHLAGDVGSVLRPYREAAEELLGQGSFTIDEVDVEDVEELDGGGRRVRILGADGSFELDGQEIGWELDGLCVRFDGFDEYFERELEDIEGMDEWEQGPFGGEMMFDALADELCRMVEDSFVGRAVGDGPSVVVVEDRGGWAVSPMDTALLAVRDVLPHLDRDGLVALAGRPDLVTPDGEAPIGEVFEVALGDMGVATRTLTVPEDVELVVTVADEDAYGTVVGPDGEEPAYGDDGFLLEGGVEYRLVVEGFGLGGSGGGPVEVALGEAASEDLGEVSLAGTVTGTLTAATPIRRTSLTLDREVRAEVVVDADVIVEVYEDGEFACVDGEWCTFAPGSDYELVVQRTDPTDLGEEVDYEVAFDVQPATPPGSADEATIDGTTSVSGELVEASDAAFHHVVVPEGASVTVTIEADDPDEDVDASIDGEVYEEGGDELFVLDGPIDEDLEVYLYTDGPTGYVVTLEPA